MPHTKQYSVCPKFAKAREPVPCTTLTDSGFRNNPVKTAKAEQAIPPAPATPTQALTVSRTPIGKRSKAARALLHSIRSKSHVWEVAPESKPPTPAPFFARTGRCLPRQGLPLLQCVDSPDCLGQAHLPMLGSALSRTGRKGHLIRHHAL
jgi:hypothetical protein